MTGCLSACKKYKVALSNDDVSSSGEVDTQSGASETLLSFTVNDGYYVEEEQYIIYDFNSFVADTGGYMGLVLGTSFLSIYDQLIVLLRRMKMWRNLSFFPGHIVMLSDAFVNTWGIILDKINKIGFNL